MVDYQGSTFSDDTPKKNPWTQDLLGYRGFSERLTKVLAGIEAPLGFVIGLHGSWGSGKSTTLNFIEALMKKRSEEEIEGYSNLHLIRFEPWIVSGHQDLVAAFFKILSEKLADGFTAREKRRRRAGRAIKVSLDPVVDAAATLGATIDHTGGLASRGAASLTKKTISDAVERWLAEPSLQSTYEKLVERLATGKQRFIVMIDDIDRLSQEEIGSIMQMVKTIGRLPHVTYLLAYDRDIVWAALRGENSAVKRGPEFAEKIVQHEVELPRPSSHALMKMLDAGISMLPEPPPESMWWMEMAHAGILRWVKHPRDVARLSNAIRFSWPALQGEIDPQDLLCMEGLRLFERPIYNWIRDNRDMLLGEGRSRLLLEEQQKEAGVAFRASLPDTDRENIVALLCVLFPNKTKFFRESGHNYGGEFWYQVVSRRGIATKAGFDAYFSLSPVATEIPKSLVDLAMNHTDDQPIQEKCMREALSRFDEHGNTLIGNFFQELEYRYTENQAHQSQALLNALFNIFDSVQEIDWKGNFFSPFLQHRFLVQRLLKGWSQDKATDALFAAISQCTSMAAKASILLDQARECGLLPSDRASGETLVEPERLKSLGSELAKEIESAALIGKLDDLPVFYDISRIWSTFGDSAKARSWISKISNTDGHKLAKVAKGLLGYSRTLNGRNYGMNERPDESLYDLDQLRTATSTFYNAANLSDDERACVIALHRGLKQLAAQDAVQPKNGETLNEA